MEHQRVLDRLEAAGQIETSILSHGTGIAAKLSESLVPPEPSEGVDFAALFRVLSMRLVSAREELTEAETVHVRTLTRLATLRSARKKAAEALRKRFLRVRRLVVALFAKDASFRLAGIEGRSPSSPIPLIAQAEQTLALLERPTADQEPVALDGAQVSLPSLAEDLRPVLATLQQTHRELGLVHRATQGTRIERNAALDRLSQVHRWIAQLLESLFQLAGEPELAEKVLETLPRRRRRQAVEPPADPSPNGASPANDSTPEPGPELDPAPELPDVGLDVGPEQAPEPMA